MFFLRGILTAVIDENWCTFQQSSHSGKRANNKTAFYKNRKFISWPFPHELTKCALHILYNIWKRTKIILLSDTQQLVFNWLKMSLILGLHAISNAHLVSKAGPVISSNFHHVHDFTQSSIHSQWPMALCSKCCSVWNHAHDGNYCWLQDRLYWQDAH